MAPGNYEQMVHYEDTIKNKVQQERIFMHIDFSLKNTLRNIFGHRPIAVWGSEDSKANRGRFDRMEAGDDILIVEGDIIKSLGKIAAKTINPDLSRELWRNLRGDSSSVWSLIYFIANPIEIELPFSTCKDLFGYRENYSLRGFTSVSSGRLEEFYKKYDDLYSILQRIKQGKTYEQKSKPEIFQIGEEVRVELQSEDVEEILKNGELSEHIKVQWKLILLGLKTGARVWVPRNDQQKIQTEYKFNEFEPSFSAGIDMPAKYVENIDVVWKEEFLIDAAFEIEHTTAIYSGLLRFADLKIIAPNHPFPLFVVAPLLKKNRVREQIRRPVFKRLGLDKEVRYLSYETIDEIDKFLGNSSSGLSVDLIIGKSESIH